MTPELWKRVDHYIEERLVHQDPALAAAVTASAAAALPSIAITATQGKFLYLLARASRAQRILEIGTLGGYSTIWLARGLEPGGRLVTLELEPRHADVARSNLARAGLAGVVELWVGAARAGLAALEREAAGPFDLVFIDADKPGIPEYIEWAVRLGRPGTLLIVDNMIRKGALLDARSDDADVRGARRGFELVAGHPRLAATAIQTVGTKGYDGFLLAVVTAGSP